MYELIGVMDWCVVFSAYSYDEIAEKAKALRRSASYTAMDDVSGVDVSVCDNVFDLEFEKLSHILQLILGCLCRQLRLPAYAFLSRLSVFCFNYFVVQSITFSHDFSFAESSGQAILHDNDR